MAVFSRLGRRVRWALPGLLLAILPGCNFVTSRLGTDVPDEATQQEVAALNQQVIEALHAHERDKVMALVGDELRREGAAGIDTIIRRVGDRLDPTRYHVPHHFYARQRAVGDLISFQSGYADHRYQLGYKARHPESIATVGVVTEGQQDFVLLTVFGRKAGGQWQLDYLCVGMQDVGLKDAIDWCQEAKTAAARHDYVNAVLAMSVCAKVLRPIDSGWHYAKEAEIEAFGENLFRQAQERFPLPIPVSGVPSRPEIYNVGTEAMPTGVYPQVAYVSHLSFADTTALKGECDAVHARIDQLFPGITTGRADILYLVYEGVPDQRHPVRIARLRRLIGGAANPS